MAERGIVASSVLVGRDEALTHAWRRLGEAASGAGQLLFVAGEAGIGKTRLLSASPVTLRPATSLWFRQPLTPATPNRTAAF